MADGDRLGGTGQGGRRTVRQRGTALHHQIAVVLGGRIQSGVYQRGEALPGEPELCRLFQVSRITIRTALATLEQQGLIDRRQGIGTFVEGPKAMSVLRAPMADVLAQIEEVGARTKVELLEFGVERPPGHVRDFFAVGRDEPMHRALRLRTTQGRPIFLVETFVPDWIGGQVSKEDLRGKAFYKVLQALGIAFASGEQTISATLAIPSVATRLLVDVGAPLLQVRRFHRDQSGRPVQYVEFLSSPSVYEIQMKLDGADLPS